MEINIYLNSYIFISIDVPVHKPNLTRLKISDTPKSPREYHNIWTPNFLLCDEQRNNLSGDITDVSVSQLKRKR